MADQLTILGIAGSLRKDSYNKGALRAAQQLCPDGARLEIYDIAGLPLFNQDEERNPTAKVTEFKQKIRAADAILFCTPEYNYGVPGVMKNALDVASRPYGDNAWSGKPVALMSAAMGVAGGIRAQYQVRQCFVFLNMEAVVQPEVAIASAPQRFDEKGNLTDETSKKMIRQLLENLVAKARLLRQPARQAA
ncbi:MAG: NAD(P)H-dependent oxidoreductase [Betaproteobacteria bacterium]|nr:NAD(P)H-dependent oxidoreductase [Betaproteobacteria bacterium]